MKHAKSIVAAAVLAALCAGCRSHGGLDRSDCPVGLKYAAACLAAHERDDVAATKRTVSDAPAAVKRSIRTSCDDLTESYYLYLENGQYR